MKSSTSILNIPNTLTMGRIFAIPLFFLALWSGQTGVCVGILIFSMLSDFFDGRLARALNQTTTFGAVLDPVADKCMVLAYFGYLGAMGTLSPWVVGIYYARNIAQLLAIPILSWWLKIPFKVVPKWPAKWASALAFILIPLLYFPNLFGQKEFIQLLVLILLPLSLLLEGQVLFTYVPRLVQIIRRKHDTFE